MTEAHGSASGSRRFRVGVIFGGRSAEHDVSLRSALTVMGALQAAGHDVHPIGVTREGHWLTEGDPMLQLQQGSPLFALQPGEGRAAGAVIEEVGRLAQQADASSSPALIPANGWAGALDVIFPVLHGPMGEDGTVQGLFELAGIPYVGAGVMSSSISMDKAITKQLLDRAGIPQLPWLTYLAKEWRRFPEGVQQDIERELGYPCFVKPANLGSSVGISKVHGADELAAAMELASRFDRKIVIERGANARELEVGVLGNDEPIASTVGEIVPSREFYDYEAKYVDDDSALLIPAEIPDEIAGQIRAVAIRAYRTLDCAGMARIDFFLERDTNQVFLNEVNTIPGFTSISMYPMLWEATGIGLPELASRLVELAVERFGERHGSGGQS